MRDVYLDKELKRRDQYCGKKNKAKGFRMESRIGKNDTEWRTMIRDREVAFWTETGIHEANLVKMLKDRDKAMKATLESRDKDWLNSLQQCKESVRLMTYEQVNNRALMKSLAKRQRELTESNAKILDWAMKIVSSKKKVPLPQIRISDYVPYTIVP